MPKTHLIMREGKVITTSTGAKTTTSLIEIDLLERKILQNQVHQRQQNWLAGQL